MKESDIKYLTHVHQMISDLEDTIEEIKQTKADFIKKTEKRFKKNCTLKEAQLRFKEYCSRNPKSDEVKRIKDLEARLRHVLKQLDMKKELINKIESR
tara:strand:+ start:511 stop:804 length:294 start_codon:yes stop_codon:yes gene_type:complete